jgi:hypothetical protein
LSLVFAFSIKKTVGRLHPKPSPISAFGCGLSIPFQGPQNDALQQGPGKMAANEKGVNLKINAS